MSAVMQSVRAFARDEDGAALAEYGLLIALIAVVAVVAVKLLGTNIAAKFNKIAGEIGT